MTEKIQRIASQRPIWLIPIVFPERIITVNGRPVKGITFAGIVRVFMCCAIGSPMHGMSSDPYGFEDLGTDGSWEASGYDALLIRPQQ